MSRWLAGAPRRRRRIVGAPGLRGRIVGALLITTIATLAVAAVALLGPLERLLRNAELKTLNNDVRQELPTIVSLPRSAVDAALAGRRGELTAAVRTLHLHTDGDVSLLAFPRTLVATSDPSSAFSDRFSDVAEAFQTGRPQQGFGTAQGADVARVAIPVAIGGGKVSTTGPAADRTYVLAVRKSISEVTSAAQAVRDAFITAALAGLALTLALGLVIAATLLRRLRRLRQAALRLAEGGPPIDLPATGARDEVGDLTRTFNIMQRRLQQQEQARRAFVATASHELRTPLTSLDGMLELLDDDLRSGDPDLDDARDLLTRARAQSRRLARLANDLLDLSKLDADVALRSEPVELGELSRAVVAEFEVGAGERQVRAVLRDGGEQFWALADPGSVAQILRILLDNALSVSPIDGEVSIDLSSDETIALSVSDCGPGVPENERDLIFERFKRGKSTGGRGGFGLGLAIGRELAERMGGDLRLVDGDAPGATFTLTLPRAPAPKPVSAALRS